jgi:hypothetical protein
VIYFASAITAEQLYKQNKRKRDSDKKERHLKRLDKIVEVYLDHIEKEQETAKQEPLIIIMTGL